MPAFCRVQIDQAWIGLEDVNGKETWSDGSPYSYAHWRSDEPKDDNCATMTVSGEWAVAQCTQPAPYFCKALPLAREQSCECTGESDFHTQ